MNHYRHEWEWDKGLMDRATARLGKWSVGQVDSKGSLRSSNKGGQAVLNEVRARLDDDLDTPGAVEVIDRAVERGEGVASAAKLLGVFLVCEPQR
ncbi:MAG TPA: hypothetical protein DEB20_00710 [Acidimicrobiaceae bacterium]|nr:hypothetical protein [Acidimicrobiaceae bacterium]